MTSEKYEQGISDFLGSMAIFDTDCPDDNHSDYRMYQDNPQPSWTSPITCGACGEQYRGVPEDERAPVPPDPNPWGWPTCLDCGRVYNPEDGIDRDGSCRCCYDGHEPYVTDEADGVIGGGAAHVFFIRFATCGEAMIPSEPDEDGRMTWEVA